MNKLLLATSLALASWQGGARSAVIFQENFDALTAGSTVVGQGGWTNNANGANALVANTLTAYTSPNYLDAFAGGTVQHTFTPVTLSAATTQIQFYFMPNTSTAGHNLQLSLRSSDSGSNYAFYLNLRGNRSSLDVGLDATTTTQYSFSSALSLSTWYLFSATVNPTSSQLSFSVTPAAGGSSLVSQSITLTATALQRVVVGASASTTTGEWSVDSLSIATVPEPSAASLAVVGGMALIGGWRAVQKRQAK